MALPTITSATTAKNFPVTSLTFSHVSDGNPLFVFSAAWQRTVTGVTFNGDALTLVGEDTTNNFRQSIWTLTAPDVATANVVITHGGSAEGMAGAAMNIANVGAAGATAFAGGTSVTPEVTVASSVDSIVVAMFCYFNSAAQTPKRASNTNLLVTDLLPSAGTDVKLNTTYAIGQASSVMNWTTGNFEWKMGAVTIAGTGAGGGVYAFA